MMRFAYEWLLLAPARVIADILAALLMIVPIIFGVTAGAGLYWLLQPHPRFGFKKWLWLGIAWFLGVYVTFETFIALVELPKALWKISNSN